MKKRDKIIWALYINHKCNLNCSYCYLSGLSDNRVIEQGRIRKVIDRIIQISMNMKKLPEIGFFGKEPLLNFSIIIDAVQYIIEKRYDCRISVNTNGILLSKRVYKFFSENDFRIILSIDKSISNKKHIMKFQFFDKNIIDLRTTINSKNLYLISQIIKDFYRAGFPKVSIAFDYTDIKFLNINIRDIADVLLESIITYMSIKQENDRFSVPLLDRIIDHSLNKVEKKYRKEPFCQLGKRIFSIDINGDVYPCWRFVGEERFRIGNILKDKLIGIDYEIDLGLAETRKIIPFDYICFWAYKKSKTYLKNNIKIMQAMKMTSENIS